MATSLQQEQCPLSGASRIKLPEEKIGQVELASVGNNKVPILILLQEPNAEEVLQNIYCKPNVTEALIQSSKLDQTLA